MTLNAKLENLLRDHIERTPADSDRWADYNQGYIYAIRGNIRAFIRELNLDPVIEDTIMQALTEDATA